MMLVGKLRIIMDVHEWATFLYNLELNGSAVKKTTFVGNVGVGTCVLDDNLYEVMDTL